MVEQLSQELFPIERGTPAVRERTHHFWVSSYPLFDSALFFLPLGSEHASPSENAAPASGPADIAAKIEVFDPDGFLANEVECEFPGNQVQCLDLDPLMGKVKLESGLKFAHIRVITRSDIGVKLRLHGREWAAIPGEMFPVDAMHAAFFPVKFGQNRSHILSIINKSDTDSPIRCKLFVGKRSPETAWSIAAHGAGVIELESEFREYTQLNSGDGLIGYVRLSSRQGELAVQIIERVPSSGDIDTFHAVG